MSDTHKTTFKKSFEGKFIKVQKRRSGSCENHAKTYTQRQLYSSLEGSQYQNLSARSPLKTKRRASMVELDLIPIENQLTQQEAHFDIN